MQSSTRHYQRTTFVFKDSLRRVYECFTKIPFFKKFFEKSFDCLLEIETGKSFDDLDTVIIFKMNNHHNFICRTLHAYKSTFFCTYRHRYASTSNSSAKTTTTHSFYYNTVENNTVFIVERIVEDPITQMHIGIELNENQNMTMIKLINNYLDKSRSGIKQIEALMVYYPIDRIWNILSHYDTIVKYLLMNTTVTIINKANMTLTLNDHMVIKNNEGAYFRLIIRSIIKKRKKLLLILEINGKESNIPRQMIRLFVDKITNNICMLTYINSSLVTTTYDWICLNSESKKNSFKILNNMLK